MKSSLTFSSTLNIQEEQVMVTQKQGIVSILGDTKKHANTNTSCSLRKTLSADMSSKKWLTQNGFIKSPLKKTASSEQLSVSLLSSSSSPSDVEDDKNTPTQFDIWSSIQQDKKNNDQVPQKGQFDIWSSILTSQKVEENSNKSVSATTPYIHPLVKRSASTLSEKSLEICTESLGSETGSDGFSSYPPSETSDVEEDEKQQQEVEKVAKCSSYHCGDEFQVVKYNYIKKATTQQKSFPPPISSLSRGEGAAGLRMKSHRDNGRLVLEAVTLPQQNNKFTAQREGGRLVLTFTPTIVSESSQSGGEGHSEDKNFDEEFENFDQDFSDSETGENEEEEAEEEEVLVESATRGGGSCYEFEQAPKINMINVHRLAMMANKPMFNRNPTWSNKFNETEDNMVEPTQMAQSLPPRPRPTRPIPSAPSSEAKGVAIAATTAAAASLNAYEYYWRPKPIGEQSLGVNYSDKKFIMSRISQLGGDKREMVILRGNKGDYMVPLFKGCKEPRRSLLFREPCCIATS